MDQVNHNTNHHHRPKLDLLYRLYNNGRQFSNDYLTENTKYSLQTSAVVDSSEAASSQNAPQALGTAIENNKRVLVSLLKRWKRGKLHSHHHRHHRNDASTSLSRRIKHGRKQVSGPIFSKQSERGDAFGGDDDGSSSSASSISSSTTSTSGSEDDSNTASSDAPEIEKHDGSHQKQHRKNIRRTKNSFSSMSHVNNGISMYDLAMIATKKAEDINDIYAMGARGARLLLGLDDPQQPDDRSENKPQHINLGVDDDDSGQKLDAPFGRSNSSLSDERHHRSHRRRSSSCQNDSRKSRRTSEDVSLTDLSKQKRGRRRSLAGSTDKENIKIDDKVAERAARALAIRSMVDSKWAHTIQKSPLQRLTPLDIEELRIAWLMTCAEKQTNGAWRGEIRRRLEGVGLIDRNGTNFEQKQGGESLSKENDVASKAQPSTDRNTSSLGYQLTVNYKPSQTKALSTRSSPTQNPLSSEAIVGESDSKGLTSDLKAIQLSSVDEGTTPQNRSLSPPMASQSRPSTVPTASHRSRQILNDLASKRHEIPNNLLLEIFARHNYFQNLSDEPTSATIVNRTTGKPVESNSKQPALSHKREGSAPAGRSPARLPSYSYTTAAEAAAAAFAHHRKDRRPQSQSGLAKGRSQSITDVTNIDDVESPLPPTLPKHLLEGLPTFYSDITQPEFASILKTFFIRSGTFDQRGMKQSLYQLLVQIVQESAGIVRPKRKSSVEIENEQLLAANGQPLSSTDVQQQQGGAANIKSPTSGFGAAFIGDPSGTSSPTPMAQAINVSPTPTRRKSNAVTFLHSNANSGSPTATAGGQSEAEINKSKMDSRPLLLDLKTKYAAQSGGGSNAPETENIEQLKSGVARGTELASFLGALFSTVDTARRHLVNWDDFLTHLLSEVYGIEADSRLGHSNLAGLSTQAIKDEILLRNALSLKNISKDKKETGENDEGPKETKPLSAEDEKEMAEARYRSIALANAPLMGTGIDRLKYITSRIDSLPPTAVAAEFMRRKRELKRAIKEEARRPGGSHKKKAGAINGDGASSSTTGAPNATDAFAIVEKKGYTLSYPSYSVHHVTTLKAFPQWQSVVAIDGKCAAIFSYEDIDSWGLSGIKNNNMNQNGTTNDTANDGGGTMKNNPGETEVDILGGGNSATQTASGGVGFKSAFVQRDDDVVGGARYLQFEGKIMAVECIYRDRLLIFSIGEREQMHLFQITGRNNLKFIGKFELPLFSVEHHEKLEKDIQMKEIHAKALNIAKGAENLKIQSLTDSNIGEDAISGMGSTSGVADRTPNASSTPLEQATLTASGQQRHVDSSLSGSKGPNAALTDARFKALRKQKSKEKKEFERKQRAAQKGLKDDAEELAIDLSSSSSSDEKEDDIQNQKRDSIGAPSPVQRARSPQSAKAVLASTSRKKASSANVSGLTTITCLREWRDATNSIVGYGNGAGGSSMLLLGGTREGIFFGLSVHDIDGLKRNGAQILFQYRLHTAPINDILVLPKSGRVVTCSLDGRLLSHLPNGVGKVAGTGAAGRNNNDVSSNRAGVGTPSQKAKKRLSLSSSLGNNNTNLALSSVPSITTSLLPPWKRTLYEYIGGHERSITTLAYSGDHESTTNGNKSSTGAEEGDENDQSSRTTAVKSLSSSTGEVFVSAGLEFKIFCWTDTMTRPLMVLNDTAAPFRSPIIRLMAVPATPLLYAVDAAGMVKLFDVRAGRSLGTWRTGGGSVNAPSSGPVANAMDSMDSDSEADDGAIGGGGASHALPSHHSSRKKKHGMMILNSGAKKGARLLLPGQANTDGIQILSACYTGSTHRTILFGAGAAISKFHTEARTDFSNRASQEPVLAIGISRTIIITVSTTAMRTWSAHTGKVLTTHSTDTYSVAPTVYATVDSCGGVVVIGKENGFVETFDITDGQMLKRYCYHSTPIVGIQLDFDCGLIISAAQGGDVCVWWNHDAKTHGAYVGAADPNVLAAKRAKYGVTSPSSDDSKNHNNKHQHAKSISKVRREIELMEKSPWLGLAADCGNSSSTNYSYNSGSSSSNPSAVGRTPSTLTSTNYLGTLVGALTDPTILTAKIGLREHCHRMQLCNEARWAWWTYNRWRRYVNKKNPLSEPRCINAYHLAPDSSR